MLEIKINHIEFSKLTGFQKFGEATLNVVNLDIGITLAGWHVEHRVGVKGDYFHIPGEPCPLEVKRAELSARLQRLRTSMEGGKLDLLFLELDRLGREVSHLKKSNEDLRSTIATFEDKFLDSETFSNFFSLVGSTMSSHTSAINELNKLVGQSMVLEGWRLTTDQFGLYNLQGLGDNRLRYLTKEGKIVYLNPQPVPYGPY
ncbi:unnamed protein product [marine sediment metagenome]|uniref:Uncharacterized protein n=2 Tax=marine sediment metagenome TaxID=412755 RepID=X1J740_9ZZZZ